jgi:ketosteroid isomerase-like protein
MSAERNIETARQMYEAFGRGDVEAILERVTDDVDWSTDASIKSAPWYGPRHGKEGVCAASSRPSSRPARSRSSPR